MPETVEYVTARFPEARLERVTGRVAAMHRVDDFARTGTRLRIRRQGSQYGRWLDEAEGDLRFRERSLAMPVGEKLVVQREGDGEQLAIRKVSRLLVPDLGCYEELEVLHELKWQEFGEQVRTGGRWFCRFIDGTTIVSKHGYKAADGSWLGAAEDVFVTFGGMPALKEVARFTVAMHKAKKIKNLATVIVERDIWTPAGWRYGGYGGLPHYHEHDDFDAGVVCK